jgi:hypothetical protein
MLACNRILKIQTSNWRDPVGSGLLFFLVFLIKKLINFKTSFLKKIKKLKMNFY